MIRLEHIRTFRTPHDKSEPADPVTFGARLEVESRQNVSEVELTTAKIDLEALVRYRCQLRVWNFVYGDLFRDVCQIKAHADYVAGRQGYDPVAQRLVDEVKCLLNKLIPPTDQPAVESSGD